MMMAMAEPTAPPDVSPDGDGEGSSGAIAFCKNHPLGMETAGLLILFMLAFNGLGVGASALSPASGFQVWLDTAISLLLALVIAAQAVSEVRALRHRLAHRAVLFLALCDLTLISSVVLHGGSPPAAASALALVAEGIGLLFAVTAVLGRRGRKAVLLLVRSFFAVVNIFGGIFEGLLAATAKDHAKYQTEKKQHDDVYKATAQALTDERRKRKWGGWH